MPVQNRVFNRWILRLFAMHFEIAPKKHKVFLFLEGTLKKKFVALFKNHIRICDKSIILTSLFALHYFKT